MWIEELRWDVGAGWQAKPALGDGAQLVLYFGNSDALRCADRYAELRAAYPGANIVGCSAQQNITGDAMHESGIAAVALRFARTALRVAHATVTQSAQSRAAGETIGQALTDADLAAVMVFADGLLVAGSEFTAGLGDTIGPGPLVIGGMASDRLDHAEALVGADFAPRTGAIAAVGFYGDAIRFVPGVASGWDAFGPRRRITRSSGNVLFELDEKPALGLYQRYVAEEVSAGIPALTLFPLFISPPDRPERGIVRANIAVDLATSAMTFAGHLPEGWIARLMRGNIDRLIQAAADAARQANPIDPPDGERLALVVSCSGRQVLMGQRTEEELEAAGAELGSDAKRIGFYAFGEIAPTSPGGMSDVHNQTVTITSLYEVEE